MCPILDICFTANEDQGAKMNEFWGLSSTGWTAIYTLITGGLLVGAVFAAFYAGKQWGTARTAQLEARRPYVIVTIEPSLAASYQFDLVVKNIGQRPAFNVSVILDPKPVRAKDRGFSEIAKAKMLNEPIAMIAPGQEMRAYYDSYLDRKGRADLPKTHQVALTYVDSSSKRPYSETAALDIDAMSGTSTIRIRTISDISKAIDKIQSTLEHASVLRRSGTLEVEASTELRSEKRQRLTDEHAENMKDLYEIIGEVQPTATKDAQATTSSEDSTEDDST
jgi:hypothetical protein